MGKPTKKMAESIAAAVWSDIGVEWENASNPFCATAIGIVFEAMKECYRLGMEDAEKQKRGGVG